MACEGANGACAPLLVADKDSLGAGMPVGGLAVGTAATEAFLISAGSPADECALGLFGIESDARVVDEASESSLPLVPDFMPCRISATAGVPVE